MIERNDIGEPLHCSLKEGIERQLVSWRGAPEGALLSELTFANLYLFREVHRYRYVGGSLPHIRGVTYDGQVHVLPLFPLREISSECLAGLLSEGEVFFPVPLAALGDLDRNTFTWHAVRDDADYVYSGSDLASLPGEAFRKKRQEIRKLLDFGQMTVIPLSEQNRNDALSVLRGWMRDKGLSPGTADELPCREALAELGELGLDGFVFQVAMRPAGFVVYEVVSPTSLIVRFAKGLIDFPGIYSFMFQYLSKAYGNGGLMVNFEQDLGKPNFRRTKLSFRPVALLEKFRVALKD